jgi:hypothetical protein
MINDQATASKHCSTTDEFFHFSHLAFEKFRAKDKDKHIAWSFGLKLTVLYHRAAPKAFTDVFALGRARVQTFNWGRWSRGTLPLCQQVMLQRGFKA